jgi:hypothetical protein
MAAFISYIGISTAKRTKDCSQLLAALGLCKQKKAMPVIAKLDRYRATCFLLLICWGLVSS